LSKTLQKFHRSILKDLFLKKKDVQSTKNKQKKNNKKAWTQI
jgi:hypothetical protein